MNVVVIARREMAEQKLAWAAAGYVALVGLVVPWLKPMADARGVLAVGLDLGFVLAMAAVLGASMIPADLASGRMGFYLARPVSAGQVLLGRFLGAWVLAVGGGILAALPQVALVPANAGGVAAVVGISALWAIYVLLAAHVLGTVFRSRSAWLLLDFGSVGGFAAAVHLLAGRILAGGAFAALPWFAGGTALLVLLVLAGAVYAQLALGGANLHRGHRVLSLVLAAGLAFTALLGAGFAAWTRTGGPGSLATFQVMAIAPKGDWIAVTGQGRFHAQAFLLDTATGATLEGLPWGRFSADGRRHVALDLRREGGCQVQDTDLASGRTSAWVLPPVGRLTAVDIRALSPDGRLAVIAAGDHVVVADLVARRVLHQASRPPWASRFVFPSAGVLREYGWVREGGAPIRELDLATGLWTETGRIATPGLRFPGPGGRRLAVEAGDGMALCDGRTGEVLVRVPLGEDRLQSMSWGEDGSMALLACRGDAAVLRVLDPEGRQRWAGPMAPREQLAGILLEPGTGRILVGLWAAGQGRILCLDPASGALAPVSETSGLALGRMGRNVTGALASRLRVGNGGGLRLAGPGGTERTVIRGARWSEASE